MVIGFSVTLSWPEKDQLHGDQAQVLLIIYSDKFSAIRFVQSSIWPVLARIANLSSYIGNCNSTYAGSTMLGFLPKVCRHTKAFLSVFTCISDSTTAGEEGTLCWAKHSRTVYHIA